MSQSSPHRDSTPTSSKSYPEIYEEYSELEEFEDDDCCLKPFLLQTATHLDAIYPQILEAKYVLFEELRVYRQDTS
ncbi:hypothetical protein T265_09397 [Opisthorchis viverrini]|uniref:Uncharacterized protein n=1 Tax=Opisthorchis viverrini TaxID=6198 RepID=A0A074ZAB5_OPIVI|nr:hypothetical protein T265_09397 [Opisthorchis viverrini]KER22532.1 hypothetical protein T265_09397 [Opisthorchis viverrini]